MANWGKEIIKSVKERGWVEMNGSFYPPNSAQAELFHKSRADGGEKKKKRSQVLKTGWIDDTRNIRNKEKYQDPFILLVKQQLGIEVWPEFYFSTERLYRIDYAIPVLPDGTVIKLAIEQEGGIWAKGNSGHSSGTGIQRDMDKNNLLQTSGWRLIRRTPSEILTTETIDLIKKIIPVD